MNRSWLRKSYLTLALAGCFFLVAGCDSNGNKETIEGKGDAKLTLEVSKKVLEVHQGEDLKTIVSVQRHQFSGPVVIDFPDLPQGITVKEKLPHTLPGGESEATFTFHVDPTAEPKKEVSIPVTARNEEFSRDAKVVQLVTIVESLANRQQRKKAAQDQFQARIKALDDKFQVIQTQVNDVKDNEAKVTLLRELKNRTEDFGHAKDKLTEFASAPSNSEWERQEKDVNERLTNLEKGMTRLNDRLENEKSK